MYFKTTSLKTFVNKNSVEKSNQNKKENNAHMSSIAIDFLLSQNNTPSDNQLKSLVKQRMAMPYTIFSNIDLRRDLVNVFAKLSVEHICLISIFSFFLQLMSVEKIWRHMFYSFFFKISSYELSYTCIIISYVTIEMSILEDNLLVFWISYLIDHNHIILYLLYSVQIFLE